MVCEAEMEKAEGRGVGGGTTAPGTQERQASVEVAACESLKHAGGDNDEDKAGSGGSTSRRPWAAGIEGRGGARERI